MAALCPDVVKQNLLATSGVALAPRKFVASPVSTPPPSHPHPPHTQTHIHRDTHTQPGKTVRRRKENEPLIREMKEPAAEAAACKHSFVAAQPKQIHIRAATAGTAASSGGIFSLQLCHSVWPASRDKRIEAKPEQPLLLHSDLVVLFLPTFFCLFVVFVCARSHICTCVDFCPSPAVGSSCTLT